MKKNRIRLVLSLIMVITVLTFVGCGSNKEITAAPSQDKTNYTMRDDGYKVYALDEMSVNEFPDLIRKDSDGNNELICMFSDDCNGVPDRYIINGSVIETTDMAPDNYAKILESINANTPVAEYTEKYMDSEYYEQASKDDSGKTGLSAEHFKERVLNHNKGKLIVSFSNEKLEIKVYLNIDETVSIDRIFVGTELVKDEVQDDFFAAEYDDLKISIKLRIIGRYYGGDIYDYLWYIRR